jgi:branched-chain amino acid transport system ATP-binding protein
MLRLEDLHVRRGGSHALRGVSLTVEAGEIVALIGANGAGKTTTLATVSGLLRPHSGSIRFSPDPAREAIELTRMRAEQIVGAGISHCPEGRQPTSRSPRTCASAPTCAPTRRRWRRTRAGSSGCSRS